MGDPRAKWPVQNAVELFDIATVCLVHIPRKRPGMDQVGTASLLPHCLVSYHTVFLCAGTHTAGSHTATNGGNLNKLMCEAEIKNLIFVQS